MKAGRAWDVSTAGPPGLGSALLYWWTDEGWQLGHIRRRCRRAPFIHVVGYRPPIATFAGEDMLLDPATYGSRWVLLTGSPPPAESPPERDYSQRSFRVRSRRSDLLPIIGQENL